MLRFPKYMEDPFDRKMQLEREYNKRMVGKRGEVAFRSMSHGNNMFNKNKMVYGTEVKFADKKKSETKYNVIHHETAFRPANISRGPLNKFP